MIFIELADKKSCKGGRDIARPPTKDRRIYWVLFALALDLLPFTVSSFTT